MRGFDKLTTSRRIAILGSTGSVGRNALRVIDALGSEYQVTALSAHRNIKLLAEQARKYRPRFVVVTDAGKAKEFSRLVEGLGIEVLAGPEGLAAIAGHSEVDIVLSAVVGAAGLPAALAAAKAGKRIALANKEPLVIAGELLTKTARENGAEIIPIDSEHSAIFQALQAGRADEVSKIVLTTSGGPFRGATREEIERATPEEALAHPVWAMGPKISVDSATMMNKALEVIEARWLFGMPAEKIEVMVHPESIVHSLVEFVDGSVIAQMASPDMCLPIQYALTYPRRVAGPAKRLKLDEIGTLTFEKPDLKVFRAISLGFEVARVGGTAAAVFNAANEAAVEQFLAGRIRFAGIVELIEHCIDKHNAGTGASLEELLEADGWARKEVTECLKQKI
jgi:1-deoxy-D-xylulose-5-phosphate reductoisomerase